MSKKLEIIIFYFNFIKISLVGPTNQQYNYQQFVVLGIKVIIGDFHHQRKERRKKKGGEMNGVSKKSLADKWCYQVPLLEQILSLYLYFRGSDLLALPTKARVLCLDSFQSMVGLRDFYRPLGNNNNNRSIFI